MPNTNDFKDSAGAASRGAHAGRHAAPSKHDALDSPNAPLPAQNYAPSFDSGDYIRVRKRRKRTAPWKKALIGIVAGILAIALIAGGAVFAYMASLSSSIAYDGDQEALNAVLTETNYEDPFYVLVIGSDEWEDYGARSDAMILLRVDEANATITMVSVPRDTPYQIDGQTVKLNEVYSQQGEIACIAAVSEVTGVPISHYVEVDFSQLSSVVDSLGGIMVDVPYAIDYEVYTQDQPTVHLDAGSQILNGEQAVALARMRTAYGPLLADTTVSEDAVRQANIRAMMTAIMKEVLGSTPAEIPSKVQEIASMVQTDIPMTDLVNWATTFAAMSDITVYSCTGPYAGGIDAETGLWLTEEAPAAWAALMEAVDSGQDPTGVLTETDDGSLMLVSTDTLTVGDDEATADDSSQQENTEAETPAS